MLEQHSSFRSLGRVDLGRSAEPFHAFAHARQAQTTLRVRGRRHFREVEPAPDVLELEGQLAIRDVALHEDGLGVRVLRDVRNGFLGQAKHRDLELRAEPEVDVGTLATHGDAKGLERPLREPANRGQQPEVVEDRRSQVVHQAVQFIDRDLNYSKPTLAMLKAVLPWHANPAIMVPAGVGVGALVMWDSENLLGQIAGTVTSAGVGVSNVEVELLDDDQNLVLDVTTFTGGTYQFNDLAPGGYSVMLVEPLGYSANENPRSISIAAGQTATVDFSLTATVVGNNARNKEYWQRQSDVYLTGKGKAQETRVDLNKYISAVHQYYTPHFSVFAGLASFADRRTVLTTPKKATMAQRAKAELAALVLNLVSLKIGQYTVVSVDGRTAGDVLTYVS